MFFRFHIKTVERIKYEKKHKDLFKKFHTKEGLELANKEAFESLMKIDTRGEYWQEPEYENHFGYKRPKQKSQSAYDMLTKIEKESEPGERSLAVFKKHTMSMIDNLSDI